MLALINELWHLKRDIVSDDFDRALTRLLEDIEPQQPSTLAASTLAASNLAKSQIKNLKSKIHRYPSGERCWTWRIPEKWTCQAASLETLDGKRLLDYAANPLHVVSYSLPFEGVVSRDELLKHLHVHSRLPEAIPFVFKYYDRDWGLCASQKLRDSLKDDRYRVVIRTTFEPGELKVGEIVIPGESEQSFMLVAHLCHPAMVNDDLTGVVVGLETARALLAGKRPYYTYRLLILPETIGSVAYLSHNEGLIPNMAGGLFLEMLGNASAHALQGSFLPESQADRCMSAALRGLDPHSYQAPYRRVIANDERQFNAPGVRVPMLSISRVEPADSPTRPYREYHSSLDTPTIVTQERLEDSLRVILGMLEAWENNYYVVNNFKGEIFCSGYGIWVDYRVNPESHRRLFEIMERCDGEHTIADIAHELDISFQAVWEVVSLLKHKDLVWLSRTAQPTDPHKVSQ